MKDGRWKRDGFRGGQETRQHIEQAWALGRKGQTNGERADRNSTESERVTSKEKQREETGEMGTQEGDADGGGGHQERNRFQSCCGGRSEDIATAWLWGGKVREELVTMTA